MTGTGTRLFEKKEAERLATELNEGYPDIDHDAVIPVLASAEPAVADVAQPSRGSIHAHTEVYLRSDRKPHQPGMSVPPICPGSHQARPAAVRSKRARSRTARPDTQSLQVSWKGVNEGTTSPPATGLQDHGIGQHPS